MTNQEELRLLASFEQKYEAEMASARLKEDNIESIVHEQGGGMDPFSAGGGGGALLVVHQDNFENAATIIRELGHAVYQPPPPGQSIKVGDDYFDRVKGVCTHCQSEYIYAKGSGFLSKLFGGSKKKEREHICYDCKETWVSL